MKRMHQSDLYAWSEFNRDRNIDFHGLLWVRPEGNIAIDPLPLSEHDAAHLASLGKLAWVVVTNSDHTRDAQALAARTGAKLAGPRGEQATFPFQCDVWLDDGDELVPGLRAFAMQGSKTPGELALVLGGATLITGDLIRAHEGGSLTILPDDKLKDRAQAVASVARLAALPGIDAVLVGDGWPLFRGGGDALRELAARLLPA
jgi:glyoxylase-like metal-dependent hydrolase (beta-lactamase superfamily II)